MLKRIIITTLLTIAALCGFAQEFSTSVSSTSVSVGDQVQVTFSLNTTGKNFRAPTFTDFNVLMGPNQSTQMQIINGAVSQTISFTYILQAIKEGTFKIGSAEIYAGNTKIQSNPVTITVTKSAPKPQSQGGGGNAQQQQADNSDAVNGGKNVYLKAKVDKTSAYNGEGISVTFCIYSRVQIYNYSPVKIPSFTGFWSQEITMPQQRIDYHNENVDGVQYQVYEVKKYILFPQRTGALVVDPMEADVVARVQVKRQQRSNDPFDQFFNDPFFNSGVQNVKVSMKSDPIKINVKELPPNAPAGYTGAVGKFAYEVNLDKKQIKTNDAVNLKIKISGKGNIRLIDAPKIEFPPEFETYDPKENVTANATGNGVTGTKTFEYLMIPRNPGNFKLQVEPFSYFDLEKKMYVTIPSHDLALSVDRGSDSEPTVISGVNKSDVQILGKDIRFIKTKDPELVSEHGALFNSPVFYTFVISPAVLFLGLILVRRRRETMAGNVTLIKSQRANKVAMKRLSSAKNYIASNEREKFLDEMFRALWGFISDKLQIPVSDLSKDNVATALQKRNVPDHLIVQFTDTVDSCEFARFAGGMADSNETIYKKGIETITALEGVLK